MIFRLFIIGAIVLIVLGIIASASATGQLWSTWWYTWFMAAFLSFLVDIALGAFYLVEGRPRRPGQPVV